jgi:HTH-type transcriptional regulator/antitoxin HigA
MIVNERQYQASRKQVELFEQALSDSRGARPREGVDPKVHAAMVDGIKGELRELRRQVRRYEEIKAGKVTTRKVRRVAELPEALIEARIARHLTQKQLAEQMGMAEQQIQRYEQQRYGRTSLDRVAEIAEALGLDLGAEVRFAKPAKRAAAAAASDRRVRARSRPRGRGRGGADQATP